jgi:hypothetical protein
MSKIDALGYEQLKALDILSKVAAEVEGTALCSEAGCSWDESFAMAESGLLQIREDNEAKRLYMSLTDAGREAAAEATAFLERNA